MNTQAGYGSSKSLWGYCYTGLILLFCGCLLVAPTAEAALQPQAISGTVEVLLAGDQQWQPLTAGTTLKSGDQVRTGPSSSVELWFEDGSVLNLSGDTQLSVSQLEISTGQQSRIAKFKLWWGAVTAKVTKLAFTENVWEIETDTVMAGIKFTDVTVRHSKQSARSEVIAKQGLIDVAQIGEGFVAVVGMLNDTEGVEFGFNAIGANVLIGVQKVLRQITIESDIALQDIQTMLEGASSLVKVENAGSAGLDIGVQGVTGTLGATGAATFGAPPGFDLLFGSTQPVNLSFSYKQRTNVPCDGLYAFPDTGSLTLNGETIPAGPTCLPLGGQQPRKGRAVTQQEETPVSRALLPDQEEPQAPAAPDTQGPRGASFTPTPSPSPTATPTETPEPEEPPAEEEEEEPEPSPSPTPTSTPDDDDDDDDDDGPAPHPPAPPASPSGLVQP